MKLLLPTLIATALTLSAAPTKERVGAAEIRFAVGAYNFREPSTKDAYLGITDMTDFALVGTVDAAGQPVTRLERNITLNNDMPPPLQTATLVIHSLSDFFKEPHNISTTGNVFKNPNGPVNAVAIDVRHPKAVEIHDNVFEGFSQPVMRDGKRSYAPVQ